MTHHHILTALLLLTATHGHAQTWADTLQTLTGTGVLAGAVTLVADADNVLEIQAAGWADIQAQTPMTPDTLFWIASMTKGITAAALMILADEGKLTLDDPVAKHIPKLKDLWVLEHITPDRITLTKAKTPITIRQLLSHTSGLPFLSPQEQKIDDMPLREKISIYAQTPLLTQPGTAYQYSNAGINIAGRIIETVSGIPYQDFLQQRLFTPLGMTDTTFWPTPALQFGLKRSQSITDIVESQRGFKPSDRNDPSKREFLTNLTKRVFKVGLVSYPEYHDVILKTEIVPAVKCCATCFTLTSDVVACNMCTTFSITVCICR